MMGYSLHLIEKFDVLDDEYPNAQAYLQRLKVRNAFSSALSA